MGKRNKEDEKIERTIRALLKLPENKRCINCNSLGPQYVCTTFLTFVCTNCSGIHREFTHRVKSVSMAKFTAEEVNAIQTGGNERAREIYFKYWDEQRNSLPDGSNLQRLRDFIKNVYEGRKYTGERMDKLPVLRLANREDFGESRKIGSYFDTKSPSYEDRHEQSYNKKGSPARRSDERTFKCNFDERRSPKCAQENSRYGGSRRNPVHFEIVDDRIRDARSGSNRRHESLGFSDRECKSGGRSSNLKNNIDSSKYPVVHPFRHSLGGNAPSLHICENSEMNTRNNAGGSSDNQNITSSDSQKSIDRNISEHKKGNLESLIGFDLDSDSDSEPSNAVAILDTQQMPASIEGGNQLSCELSSKDKTPQASTANTLEFLLYELSAPAPSGVTIDNIYAPPNASKENMALTSVAAAGSAEKLLLLTDEFRSSTTEPATNLQEKPSNVGPLQAVNGKRGGYNNKVPDGPQLPSMCHHQPSAFHYNNRSSSAQGTAAVTALNNQPYTSSLRDDTQGPSNVSFDQSTRVNSRSTRDTNCGIGMQPSSTDAKSSGWKELPMDIFFASHSSTPVAVPGWQTSLPNGMGFGMQYYPREMHVPAFPNAVKPTNPFDINSETATAHVSSFPSMTSLQGAMPNDSATAGLLHASNFGAHPAGLMTSHPPSYTPMMPPQSPFGTYMVEQSHRALPPSRQQEIHGFAGDGAISGSLVTMQRPTGGYSAATSPNYFHTMGGNPFG